MPSKRKSNKRAKMEKRRIRHNQNKKEGVSMTENIAGTTAEEVAEAAVAESKAEEVAEAAVTESKAEEVAETAVTESKAEEAVTAIEAAETVNSTTKATETADVTEAAETAVIVEEEQMENKKPENVNDTKETVHKLYIQYNDLEFSDELLFEAAVNAYCNESGMDKSSVKAVNLYVKPQEGRAYYVINNDAEKSGSIEL